MIVVLKNKINKRQIGVVELKTSESTESNHLLKVKNILLRTSYKRK